jgi:DNA-binding NtrC family response regulator
LPRILLVEDDLDVRLLLEHVLVREGYEVETSDTVSGGIGHLQSIGYDLLLADAKLPDGTGMKVADAAAEKGIKALIMTGYAFTLPVETLERYEVLLKPLRPAELVGIIERTLRD